MVNLHLFSPRHAGEPLARMRIPCQHPASRRLWSVRAVRCRRWWRAQGDVYALNNVPLDCLYDDDCEHGIRNVSVRARARARDRNRPAWFARLGRNLRPTTIMRTASAFAKATADMSLSTRTSRCNRDRRRNPNRKVGGVGEWCESALVGGPTRVRRGTDEN